MLYVFGMMDSDEKISYIFGENLQNLTLTEACKLIRIIVLVN
jgi:hypothetical protein